MMRPLLLFIVLNVVLVVIGVAEIPVVLGAQLLLVGSHQPIVALVGQDVLLPCYLKPAVSADDETVEWTRSGLTPKYVHFHKDGRLWFEKQDESYFLRTRLFMDELPRGNVSMQIFKVKESDAGTYKCSLPSMKTEAHIQLIVGLRLHCPDKAMKAVAGQNVTLQCSTIPPVKPDIVDWLVKDTCDVYLLLGGKVDLDQQCEDYKGKASLYHEELSSGNSSLRLMTQLSHSGRYRCTVRVKDEKQNCSIILTVSLPREHDTVQDKTKGNQTAVDPPGNSNNAAAIGVGSIVGISGAVVGGGVLVLLVVVLYLHKKRKQRQRRQSPDQNNEPVDVQLQDRDPAEEEPMNLSGNRDEIEMRIM